MNELSMFFNTDTIKEDIEAVYHFLQANGNTVEVVQQYINKYSQSVKDDLQSILNYFVANYPDSQEEIRRLVKDSAAEVIKNEKIPSDYVPNINVFVTYLAGVISGYSKDTYYELDIIQAVLDGVKTLKDEEINQDTINRVSSELKQELKADLNNVAVSNTLLSEIEKMSDNALKALQKNTRGLTKAQLKMAATIFKDVFLVFKEKLEEETRENVKIAYGFISSRESADTPTYAHPNDAGADVTSAVNMILPPHSFGNKVPTGIIVDIPKGYELQIRPRSGMSLKTKVRMSNCVGTIDAGYHGEIGVLFDNFDDEPYEIKAGDRIAQMVLCKCPRADYVFTPNAENVFNSDRGAGGFGSTGK